MQGEEQPQERALQLLEALKEESVHWPQHTTYEQAKF